VRGVNALDDARHAHDALDLEPATGGGLRLAASTELLARPRREVFAFAPYWALNQEKSWNYRLLTTVAYFGVDVKGDGTIDGSAGNPGWKGWNSEQLADMIGNAHRAGDHVVLVAKQFDEGEIARLVGSQAATQAAIGNIIKLLSQRGLDGVNVDFEGYATPKYPGIQAAVTNFMAQLTRQVHRWRPGATVTLDTYVGSAGWNGGIFDIGKLAPDVDAFFVMAYDMVFADMCCKAGPNSPLHPYPPYDVTDTVAQYLAKAPASKVILGVPWYGYVWSTKGNGPNSQATSKAEPESYPEAMAELRCAQAHHLRVSGPNWDAAAGSHWVAWYSPARKDPCGGNRHSWRELYYEDADSLGLKYDLVNARNLRGVGVWALGYQGDGPDLWNPIAAKLGQVPGAAPAPRPAPRRTGPRRPAPSAGRPGACLSRLVGGRLTCVAARAPRPAPGGPAPRKPAPRRR
jgi:spore germination protein YaaH